MADLISRKAAIDALGGNVIVTSKESAQSVMDYIRGCADRIRSLPSVQPKIKPIEYRDCANAILRMWMDNVVTDGEYKRIMDKLNAHWGMKNG